MGLLHDVQLQVFSILSLPKIDFLTQNKRLLLNTQWPLNSAHKLKCVTNHFIIVSELTSIGSPHSRMMGMYCTNSGSPHNFTGELRDCQGMLSILVHPRQVRLRHSPCHFGHWSRQVPSVCPNHDPLTSGHTHTTIRCTENVPWLRSRYSSQDSSASLSGYIRQTSLLFPPNSWNSQVLFQDFLCNLPSSTISSPGMRVRIRIHQYGDSVLPQSSISPNSRSPGWAYC